MSIVKIPYEFIRQRVELSWNEINFGIDHLLMAPDAAIGKATEQLCATGPAPKEVVELASLTEGESVANLVLRLAQTETSPEDGHVKAKWLYLVLAWLYENCEMLVDPLGLVEEVYSDFDYPREITPFVRYMPMVGPDLANREQNEARMFDNWKVYLDEAGKRFGRSA
jgi:hypothetical protein